MNFTKQLGIFGIYNTNKREIYILFSITGVSGAISSPVHVIPFMCDIWRTGLIESICIYRPLETKFPRAGYIYNMLLDLYS